MTLRMVTEEAEKEVGLIEEGKAEFVSVVRHGANRQPFRIIKGEGGVKNNMIKKIQSILVPTGMELMELQKDEKLGFLTEASGEAAKKFEHYTRYDQADIKKFDKDSIQLVKLSEKAYAIVGALVPGVEDKNIMSLSSEFEKAATITDTVFDAPIEAGRQFTISFGDIFHKELDAFVSVVINSMRQSAGELKKRKQMILNAFEAFKSFMVMGLDTVDTAKFDETILDNIQSVVTSKEVKNINQNLEDQEMTKEEIQAMIDSSNNTLKDSIVTDVTKSLGTVVSKAITDNDKAKADKLKNDTDAKKKADDYSDLIKTVKTQGELLTKIGSQLNTDPSDNDVDDTDKNKSDDNTDDDTQKKNPDKKQSDVFTGLMFKQA